MSFQLLRAENELARLTSKRSSPGPGVRYDAVNLVVREEIGHLQSFGGFSNPTDTKVYRGMKLVQALLRENSCLAGSLKVALVAAAATAQVEFAGKRDLLAGAWNTSCCFCLSCIEDIVDVLEECLIDDLRVAQKEHRCLALLLCYSYCTFA